MHTTPLIRLTFVGGLVAALLGIVSGGADAATGSVPKAVVEAQAARSWRPRPGRVCHTSSVRGNLPGKVGASIKCVLTPKGSKLKYPVVVRVNAVKKGTAHFHVQVGQAIGAANKAKFCADTAILDRATATATVPSDLIPIFESNVKTLNDLQGTAPSAIVATAGPLVQAARNAVNSGNADAFASPPIQKDIQNVSTFCGLNIDGTPAG